MINRLHYEMIRLYSGDPMRIQHFCKVHSYAKLIAEMEHIDASTLFILEAAALTHDIGIHLCEEKYGSSNGKLQEKEGPAIAEKLLKELQFEEKVIERVKYLIAHHHTYDAIDGIDYQILVEADFLVNILEDGLAKEQLCRHIKIFLRQRVERTSVRKCLRYNEKAENDINLEFYRKQQRQAAT